MVRGEGLEVLEERMKTIDPGESGTYKFLGIEQADAIKAKKVLARVKGDVNKRVKMLINTELNDVNLVCNQHYSDTTSSLFEERL